MRLHPIFLGFIVLVNLACSDADKASTSTPPEVSLGEGETEEVSEEETDPVARLPIPGEGEESVSSPPVQFEEVVDESGANINEIPGGADVPGFLEEALEEEEENEVPGEPGIIQVSPSELDGLFLYERGDGNSLNPGREHCGGYRNPSRFAGAGRRAAGHQSF